MFIDFQHSCWSKLNLEGLEFSGTDCTQALFVGSQNLTEARHCCFDKINSKGLVKQPGADLTGTYSSHEGDAKQVTSYYFFWGLSYLLQSTRCKVRTEKDQQLCDANRALTHIKRYLKDDKGFMLTLHLATIAFQQTRPQEALNHLFTTWQLDKAGVTSILKPKSSQPISYLSPLGWRVLNLKKIKRHHHRDVYTQLSKKVTAASGSKNREKQQQQVNKKPHRNSDEKLEQEPLSNEWIPEYPMTAGTDTLRQEYLEFLITLWPYNVRLYNELCNSPNPYGVRQSERLAYEKLSDGINTLFQVNKPQQPNNTALPTVELTGVSCSQGYLHPDLIEQMIDLETGKFKKDNTNLNFKHSQHDVVRLDFQGHSLHIKAYPDFPMMDYLTDIFNRRLVGVGSPPSEFAVITITFPAKAGKQSISQRLPVLISLTIEGPTLKTVLADNPQLLDQLDRHTTSAVFLSEMLKHPGDGFSRNYVVTPTHTLQPLMQVSNSKKTPPQTIISVDNSQMFVEPVVKTKTGNVLYECSILYCLKIFQSLSLSHSLMASFKDLNILGLLRAWLQTTQVREKTYLSLIRDDEDEKDIPQWNEHRSKHQKRSWFKKFFPDNNPFIPIALLRPSVASLLAIQLQHLKSLIAFAVKENEPIKLLTIFKTLNPRIQNYYTQLDQTSLDSEELFKIATGKLISMSSAKAIEAITGEVLKEQDIHYEWRSSRAQSNSYLEAACAELDVINFDTYGNFEKNNNDEYILSVNFYSKQSHASQAKLNAFQQQRWLNNLSLQKLSFSKLTLKYCDALSDALLIALLDNSTQLTHLEISGCTKVTQASLRHLANNDSLLVTLKANCTDISRIQAKNAKPLQFPVLKTFHCSGLETNSVQQNTHIKGLTLVHLGAPQLIQLKLGHQPNLITVKLLTPKLQHLMLKDCPKLSDEGLHCPEHDLQEIQLDKNNNNFSHIEFRTRYPILFSALQWQHYSDTFVEQLDELFQILITRHNYPAWMACPLRLQQDIAHSVMQWGINGQQAIPKLLQGFKNKAVAHVLGLCAEHRYQHVITMLIKVLNGKNSWQIREAATKALGHCAEHLTSIPEELIPALIKALSYKEPWEVRKAATEALRCCTERLTSLPDECILGLIKALNDKETWEVRKAATEALRRCTERLTSLPDELILALIKALNDKETWEVRKAATEALRNCIEHHPGQVIPALIKALNDKKSWEVREAATEALRRCAEHRPEQVIPALIKALSDKESWQFRKAAIEALRHCVEHRPEQVIPALIKALNDKESWQVRKAATEALRNCIEHFTSILHELIPVLIKALNDKELWLVRKAEIELLRHCAEHLTSIPDELISALIKALNEKELWQVREAATEALGHCAEHLTSLPDELISALIKALNDKKSDVRHAATEALRYCAEHLTSIPDELIPALVKALNDKESWEVREAVTDALRHCAEHHPEQVIPALIKALNDKESDVRYAAIKALGHYVKHRLEQVIPALIKALNDKESWEVRKAATEALGHYVKHHPEQVIPALIKALNDKKSDVRYAAIEALGHYVKHRPEQVIPALIKALNDKESWEVRKAATEALGHCAEYLTSLPDELIPALIKALNDKESWEVREAVTEVLRHCAEHHPEQVILALIKALNDKESDVRYAAAKALRHCAERLTFLPDELIPRLIKALNDKESWEVRKAATEALRYYTERLTSLPDELIPALIKALNDKESWEVRKAATEALRYYTERLTSLPDELIPALIKALSDKKSYVRYAATETLEYCAEHHPEQVIPVLIKALNEKKSYVRYAAAKALGHCIKHHPEQVIPALIKALNDKESWEVRKIATKALRYYTEHLTSLPDELIPRLIKALNDKESWEVRIAATEALRHCAEHLISLPDELIPALIKALNDKESWEVQKIATTLEYFTEHHPEQVIPALIKVLNDKESWQVRKAATDALGHCAERLTSIPNELIPVLIKVLNDKELKVRNAAIEALGYCAEHLTSIPDELIPALIKALNDKESSWQGRKAADVLGKFVSFESLKKVVTRHFENVKSHADENHNSTQEPSPHVNAASYQNLTSAPTSSADLPQLIDSDNKEPNVQHVKCTP